MRNLFSFHTVSVLTLLIAGGAPAFAQSLSIYDEAPRPPGAIPQTVYERVMRTAPEDFTDDRTLLDQSIGDVPDIPELSAQLRRQIVSYPSREAPGTIVIDTPRTYLYYVLGDGQAIRYGIGVGREGFTWAGVRKIDRKVEWPDWEPPAEMIERQPYLPRWIAGGTANPLGARAMYLAGTLYRIHGTNEPATIGHRVSSGCIRMLNEHAIDLYNRVNLGAKVVVMPDDGRRARNATAPVDGFTPRPVISPTRSRYAAPANAGYSGSGLY